MAKKNAISGKIEIEISGVKYTATVEFKETPKAEAKETPKYKAWGVRIDLEKVIAEKHTFNKTRPFKHGGKNYKREGAK